MADESRLVGELHARVALDLMSYLIGTEMLGTGNKPTSEKQAFTLYRKCYKAVEGYKVDRILDESE